MKKNKIIYLTLIILLNFSINIYSQEKINPTEKGKEIFNIFKSINSTSNETYVENFIDIELLRNIVRENKNLDENKKNEILHKPKEIWHEKFIQELDEIKVLGEKYKINWNEIKYSDFTYNINEKNKYGVKKYSCMLVFKTKELENRIYGIEVDLLEINNQLYIIEIDDLKYRDKN